MQDEFGIIKRLLPQMLEVMNVIPGEKFVLKESDTLLILQRRMEESDLKKSLFVYNNVFAETKGANKEVLCECAKAVIKVEVLVNVDAVDFDAFTLRELIKKYKAYEKKVTNIIHLSKVNAMTADDYQKEIIALTEEKNQLFLEAFHAEVELLEKKIERIPLPKAEESVEAKYFRQKTIKSEQEVIKKERFFSKIEKRIAEARHQKEVELELKNVEKSSAITKCVEIPFYDKSLSYTQLIKCKDIPAYVLLKRNTNVFFGLLKNVRKGSYDNTDQSLIELTEATDEFVQFMEVDLLSDEYDLPMFGEKEKEGLYMYFDFMIRCFEKHIGVTLTVQEYLSFKGYYNRLVLKMFSLEKKAKEDYLAALSLADSYLAYMKSYGLSSVDDEETVIGHIIDQKREGYVEDIHLILDNHMVDESAKKELEKLKNAILDFGKPKEESTELVEKEVAIPISSYEPVEVFGVSQMGYPIVNQRNIQIVVQLLNQNREIIDEAVYAGNNFRQALKDYEMRPAHMKRIGFRENGQDVFYEEDL